MKICPCCKTPKIFPEEFNSQGKYCLICHAEKSRLWRENNKEKNETSQKKHLLKKDSVNNRRRAGRKHYNNNKNYYLKKSKKRGDKIRKYIIDYLLLHPCVDCKESDIIVLEFDHVRGKKEFSLSEAPRKCVSDKRLKEEINKCEVRCANCHRRKTANDRGYSKISLTKSS